VTDDDLTAVLDELLAETSALTRVLLGGERPETPAAPSPHDWLDGVAHYELRPFDDG
jgi:hypothetical protein